MGVLIAPETPYGKELWKWEHHQGETHPQDNKLKGMRPNGFQPYPAMLYKATKKNPWAFDQELARDEHEQRNLESRGFVCGGQQAACEAYDEAQHALAVAAAERNYEDRRLSEKARVEVDAAEQASSRHLGEIPVTPIRRKPGPKPKQLGTE